MQIMCHNQEGGPYTNVRNVILQIIRVIFLQSKNSGK